MRNEEVINAFACCSIPLATCIQRLEQESLSMVPGSFHGDAFHVYGYVLLAKSFLRQVRYRFICKSPFIHMPVFGG